MKVIYFLRHAHSLQTLRQEDVERPLDVRGKLDASRMANYVKEHLISPEVFYVSHAKRAQQTARYFKDAWGVKDESYILTSSLYDFEGEKVKDFIYNLPEEWSRVLLVGHNFGITEAINYFGDKAVDALPTSGLVSIKFEYKSWQALRRGEIEHLILPETI